MKNVSITKFDEAAKEIRMEKYADTWHGVEVTITPYLSLRNMVSFVDAVVDSCFQGEDKEYYPEVRDFAVRVAALDEYTNITIPSDNEHKCDMVYGTDIFEWVLDRINISQFNEMMRAIDIKIEHIMRVRYDNIRKDLETSVSRIEQMTDMIGGIMGDLNPDEIKKLLDAVSENQISEEKVVKAYMEEMKKQ